MRCKLLLQHYARYQEQPTAQVEEVGGGATAKSAELVKGVTLRRKLPNTESSDTEEYKQSHSFSNNLHRLQKIYANFIEVNSECKSLPPPPSSGYTHSTELDI
jgi:hypothetical protein